jgi:cytidylate kinase
MDKFLNYFDARHRESILKKPSSMDGPVITLSRLTGCDARQIATVLVEEMNKKYATTKWKWVDKDIIYAIARELNTGAERVENFYKGFELTNLSEMIMAFSGNFISDLRVKKAIREVVLSICKEGHIILVGRGGASIAQDITDSLHIRIIAPFYWRVQNVMKKKQLTLEQAEEYCIESDEKRHNLILDFLDKRPLNIDYLFDATLNRKSYSINELAEIIVSLYDTKVVRQAEERNKMNKII